MLTMVCVCQEHLVVFILVNDDYEGGDLVFKYPGSGEEKVIPKKKNSMIVWPSTFLYPHTVTSSN